MRHKKSLPHILFFVIFLLVVGGVSLVLVIRPSGWEALGSKVVVESVTELAEERIVDEKTGEKESESKKKVTACEERVNVIDWTIYRNKIYGFEFQYTDASLIREEYYRGSQQPVRPDDTDYWNLTIWPTNRRGPEFVNVTVREIPIGLSSFEKIKEVWRRNKEQPLNVSFSDAFVSETKALRAVLKYSPEGMYGGGEDILYYLYKGKRLYTISFPGVDIGKGEEMHQQTIRTFKLFGQ